MILDDPTEYLDILGAVSLEADLETLRILRISSTAEEIFGYSTEQCCGEGFFLSALVHSDDMHSVASAITQALENGRAETYFRALRQDGQAIRCSAVFGVDRAAAEPRLRGLMFRSESGASSPRVSEERLQLALESAEMGVWDWDVRGASIYWSEELYRLHASSPEELGDLLDNYQSLVQRIHPDDFETVQTVIMHSLRTGADYDIEYRFRLPDGTYRWLYVKGRMYVDDDQNPIRVAGTAQDVTVRKEAQIAAAHELDERKRAESALKKLTESLEQRVRSRTDDLQDANTKLKAEIGERTRAERDVARANRRLMQSNRELQDFAYVASHDLKEPLRKIATFADLIRVDCADDLGDEGRFYIERMQESAARMTKLINDLLEFSRVKTSEESFSTIDLNEILRHVLSDLDVRIRESEASVRVGDLPSIDADPTQMRQLFQNLISNALKFRRADATPVITISPGPKEVSNPDGRVCRLVVEDNGIGFEPKYADRVFSPFQRLQKSYEGTGMGLAICRRIIERHHGSIDVDSAPGKGTTFYIELPVSQDSTGNAADQD